MKALLKRRHVYAPTHRSRRLRRRSLSLGLSLLVLLAGAGVSARIATVRHAEPDAYKPPTTPVQLPVLTIQSNSDVQHVAVTQDTVPLPAAASDTATDSKALQVCKPAYQLSASTDDTLVQLAPYEKSLCGLSLSSSLVYLTLPASNDEADALALQLDTKLKAFATAKLTPYVLVSSKSGDEKTGSVFDYFLGVLKAKGVNDNLMGIWVFFPAPNTPSVALDPAVFSANYMSYGTLFREYFANGKLGVLFDASSDVDTYLDGIPAGFLSSIGYQGLPATDLSAIAARQGVSSMWFDLAIPSSKTDAVARLTELQKSGIKITVNIQANDKAFQKDPTEFTSFGQDLSKQAIGFGVY